jgi:predicted ATPase/DNA-binding SARP family transcriptional activator
LRAEDWPRKKAAALLKRLALERRLLKDQAIEFLWPDVEPEYGANNFYKALHVLRRVLNNAFGSSAAETVAGYEDGVLILKPAVWVDARAFELACELGAAGIAPEQRAASLEQALALYRGELLPRDRYEEWTILPREALHRQHRQARLALADIRSTVGDLNGAIGLISPLLDFDRADEQVHYQMMRLYALSGRSQEALRQYRACVDALADELDAPPAPDTTALYEQIIRGELAAPQTTPALKASPGLLFDRFPAEQGIETSQSPVFVAREREMARLAAHLGSAASGKGCVVFIVGEAGAGKTSLMAEFAARAQAENQILVAAAGSCQAVAGIADPFLPFREIVAMLTGGWQGPWLRGELPVRHARRLQEFAPRAREVFAALAPDLAGIITPAYTSPRNSARSLSQPQVFDLMAQALRALAKESPLLLLLDDLQWVDAASANLLFYLGRRLSNSAVMIVGAYRPSEILLPGANHSLAPVVQELARHRGDIEIDLDSQTPEEGRSFVDAFLDREANRLDATFREAVFRRTRGNPLFTVELLRVLQEQQAIQQDAHGAWRAVEDLSWDVLPARVEAAIARRFDRLPEKLRQMLKVASVEGESFSLEILAQLLSMDIRRMLHLFSHELDQRYRLIHEQGTARLGSATVTRYQFRHNLFQQYLYGRLSAAERRYWHARVAAALEEWGKEGLDDLAGTLARHLLSAGDSVRAVPYLIRTGDVARRRVAIEEAAQFYQSALEHWPEDGPREVTVIESSAPTLADRASVLRELGELLLAMGKLSSSIERFTEARKVYEIAGDRIGVGAMFRLVGRAYWELADRARSSDNYHQSLEALENEPESVELARTIAAIAQMHMLGDEHDQAIAFGNRALELAERLKAEDVRVNVLTTICLARMVKGELGHDLAMISEVQERAEEMGLVHEACRAYAGLGDSLVAFEQYAEASALYERMLAYARKVQAALFEGVALVQLGSLDWWAGRWRIALDRLGEIEEWMAARAHLSMAKIWASTLLGMMYNDLGRPEQARDALTLFTSAARSANELQTTAPHLAQLARASTVEEHEGLFEEILALVDSVEYGRYDMMPALLLASSWLARQSGGDPSALRRLERVHEKMHNHQSAASLREIEGEIAALRGDWDRAAVSFRQAANEWAILQRPYDLLRALSGLALVYKSSGDGSALRQIQKKATRVIQQLTAELTEPELRNRFTQSTIVRRFIGQP